MRYRKDLEDERRGGGSKIMKYEYALESFKEEARRKGLYEKVKVIDKVKDTVDYKSKDPIKDAEIEIDDEQKRFVRSKTVTSILSARGRSKSPEVVMR